MTTSRFCPHCGADNPPANTLCHACQQPLTHLEDARETSTLLNERYAVLAEVGSGGFGAVYRARDMREQNRIVAIKQINLKGLSPQEIIEATDGFNREAQILTALSHPLLPRIFDRFNDPEHWYLVMNFIEGSTLDDYLQQHAASALPARTGLPLEETLAIGRQLCDVLHYLHSQQPPVIFRDIKPGNIMRTPRGKLYLIDFGIARHFKPGQARDTIPFGSPGFAAPEQYGRAQTSPQADIYSLGALLHCLISGDDPADHPFQFPSLRLHSIDGIRELDALIQHMVALDAALRPASIQDVRAELQCIQQISAQANKQHIWQPPQGQTPPAASVFAQQKLFSSALATRKTSRRRVVTATLIVGGAVLVGGVATAFSSNQSGTVVIDPGPPIQNTVAPADATAAAQNGEATATATTQMAAVPLNGVAYWSSDLSHAAVINAEQNQIELYKVPSQQSLLNISIPDGIPNSRIQWSLDKSKILAQDDIGLIQAWSAENGQELFTFDSAIVAEIGFSFPAITAWSPDGQYCAISYPNTQISDNTYFVILQANDGKLLFQETFPNYYPYALNTLAWSPDSKYIAFPSSANWPAGTSWTVEIWDSATYQKVGSFDGILPSDASFLSNYNSISSILWSPSGKKIATVVGGHLLWVSDFNTPTDISTGAFLTMDGQIWSPNEHYLATLDNENLYISDLINGQENLLTQGGSLPTNVVAFTWSADSQSITVVDNDNIISKWPIGLASFSG